MLKPSYKNVIVGKNYLSIIYGLMKMSLSHEASTLLVDDINVKMGAGWCNNIGQIEKSLLKKLGKKYQIKSLINIEKYIKPINTIIFLNEKMIEFGPSPYANIREIVRKLPDIFDKNVLKDFNDYGPELFDEECLALFTKIGESTQKNSKFSDALNGLNSKIEIILNECITYLQQEELVNKQLHFVLQVLYQTFFTNSINNLESKYLLISIISPRYVIDETALMDDLLFEYQSKGGVTTKANIEQWQVYEGKTDFVALDTIDGVINFYQLYYFGRINHHSPFIRKKDEVQFNSIIMLCPLEHDFINFFKNKRILISQNDRLGTDFPHWEIEIQENGLLKAIYSYANYEGTKPSFFYKKVAEDVFKSLGQILPGIKLNDWSSQITYQAGADFWVESLVARKKTHPDQTQKDDLLYDIENKRQVDNIIYCGPNRTRTLGLFSYTKDLFFNS